MSAPAKTQIKRKHTKRREVLDRIYDVLDVGVEARMVTCEMFASPGIGRHTVAEYSRTFESLGILDRRYEYLTHGKEHIGKRWHWTLRKTHAEAIAILDKCDAEELAAADRNFAEAMIEKKTTRRQRITEQQADVVAVRIEHDEPVEAIVGPDSPNPFDVLRPYRRVVSEPYALVEAARQYRDRSTKMDGGIKDLLDQAAELGLKVDEEALRAAISPIERDDRLETIALVLPYIDQLEAATARLLGQVDGLKVQVTELNKLRMDVTALRSQNQRLIAKQVSH